MDSGPRYRLKRTTRTVRKHAGIRQGGQLASNLDLEAVIVRRGYDNLADQPAQNGNCLVGSAGDAAPT